MNLKPFADKDVFIQLKHATFIAGQDPETGRLVPMSMGDRNNPTAPPSVVAVERLEGRLVEESECFVLKYPNPLKPDVQMSMGIDPENVHAIWSAPPLSRIQVVGGGIVTP